ncbi:Type II secretion system protein E [Gemmata obscuriglobus]|uniref:General secretion pathway protein GspE n=1 Tax=Gemmata obscuriglobus TaxID=114 RepID=A0A2Z3HBG1_9BACT|nr:ATPase, T2SS/T4P/T4SS family [Gemmata obscuriglobus]AWM41722.1 general secretion pathway protein GspE [Gemmata obscuriglobus]QEG32329.1 Type II secretion system protein E [Gemmata obscuriglobus]VTS11685.1 general secretion pathway protein e : General secretion pathway protein E OS=Blastopirellula marina DSM 3645 GN=DSM3645_27388 PE=4 SV=1: T2SE_Nter: T2SE [Gemmata obscuriglobus UQM 2246]
MQLLQTLVHRGLLPEGDRFRASEAIKASPDYPPHQVLIDKGFVREDALLPVLAEEFGLEQVDLSHAKIEKDVLAAMPQKLVHRKNLMPVARHNGTLIVATSDPFDVYALDELQTLTGLHVMPVLAPAREITRLIKQHFGVGGDTVAALAEEAKNQDDIELLEALETDDSEMAKAAQEASVVKLVNQILVEAANERASDIHVETEEKGIRIRYRIDGLLQNQNLPPEINRFALAIVSRLKIMARLNIAEKRLPQDGRIKMKVQGREIDVRVSIIPMIHGEGIVMRLLDKGRMSFNLKNCGMLPDIYGKFKQVIDRPHGIVLVTGPTGSGKSTTLYSALNEIKDEVTKIITVEDPVEYNQDGISQIQTHAKIGLTFSHALRSILRHDPDVILVGEIRDKETAEMAIQASLTGHMVFSTLHTNDAPSAFTRMIDMGVEPFLVSSTVEGVMAQRLVRTICPDCKTTYVPDPDELPLDFPGRKGAPQPAPDIAIQQGLVEMMNTGPAADGKLWKGTGCRACRQGGYRGRTGIHELLLNNDVMKELVVQRVNSSVIRLEALKAGMITLRQDGWRKVLNGTTTVDEVTRTTAGDIS